MRRVYILENAAKFNSEYDIAEKQNKETIALPWMKILVEDKQDSNEVKQSGPGNNQINVEKEFSVAELESWAIDSLIEYIIDKHHKFSRKNAVIIYDLSQTAVYQHGKGQRETRQLASSMFLFLHDYLNNLKKEEEILFPNIRYLVEKKAIPGSDTYSTFGLLQQWINSTKEGHQSMLNYFQFLRGLISDHSLETDAFSCYNTLSEKLNEFEMDFIVHSYIENKILFPKALRRID